MNQAGRIISLEALSGRPTDTVPVGLFTWGFDYYWKAAGIEPWKLVCGGVETWHKAHTALYERHRPDLIFYSGAGNGTEEPTLENETSDSWFVRDNNNCNLTRLIKSSLTPQDADSGGKDCDSVGEIDSTQTADQLVAEFTGWGSLYLQGLSRLIADLGDNALVLPHHSPAYICACYAFGFERAMEAMLSEPELFVYVCDRYASGDELRMRDLAEAGAQAVFIADGWASCDIISPGMFKEFALPYQKSITEAAHKAGLKIIMWNEGDILPILSDEATVPFDAFAFEQPRKGALITVDRVREVFGPNRCLFGNLDSEELLGRGNVDEITRAVHEQLRQSGKNAPFILNTGSPIPSNTSPEAVDAMIKAARM